MEKIHILVAEDDPHIRMGLVDILEGAGYRVSRAEDGDRAMAVFKTEPVDLVLLDIMMPEKSGFDVCRDIRKQNSRVPIIMLTAKGEEMDKVMGLHSGADDYITKPFGIQELLARIAAVLRRCSRKSGTVGKNNETPRSEDPAETADTFRFGPCTVNTRTFKITRPADEAVPDENGAGNEPDTSHSPALKGIADVSGRTEMDLTQREVDLLFFFQQHPGEVLSRDDLLNAVWGIDYLGTTRTLDQHIAKLRKKVEPVPSSPRFITTVHGVGYRYEP